MATNRKILLVPSLARRFGALFIDYGVILGYMGLLGLLFLAAHVVFGETPDWLGRGVAAAEIWGFLILVLPVGLYLYVSESSDRRATLGKRALGLQVVANNSGGRAGRAQIAVRTIIKLLPWELAHFFVWHAVAFARGGQETFPLWLATGLAASALVPFFYVLVVALQPKGRGPHDLAAGTRVVRLPQPG